MMVALLNTPEACGKPALAGLAAQQKMCIRDRFRRDRIRVSLPASYPAGR